MNNTIVSENNKIVEHLNDNFQSVFTTEDVCAMGSLKHSLVTQANICDIANIHSAEVLAHLKRMKPNKAERPDEIFARFLTECSKQLSVPLALIFTKYLVSSNF